MKRISALTALVLLLAFAVTANAGDNFRIEEQIWTLNADGTRNATYKEIIYNQSSEKITEGSFFLKEPSGKKPGIDFWTDLEGREVNYSSEPKPRGFEFFYEYPVPIEPGEFGGFIVQGPLMLHEDFYRVGDVAVFSPGRIWLEGNTLLIFRLRLPKDTQIVTLAPEKYKVRQYDGFLEITFMVFHKESAGTRTIHCEFVPGKEALDAIEKADDEFYVQEQVLHLNPDLSAEYYIKTSHDNHGEKNMEDFKFRNSYDTVLKILDDKGRELNISKREHPDGNGFLYTVYLIDPVEPGKTLYTTLICRSDNVYRFGRDKVCIIKGPHTPIPATDFIHKIIAPKGTQLVYSLLDQASIREENDSTVILMEKHLARNEGVYFAVVLDVPGVDEEKLAELDSAEQALVQQIKRLYTVGGD